jgi:hypothetical protein
VNDLRHISGLARVPWVCVSSYLDAIGVVSGDIVDS